jgi:hypothetical protein
MADHPAPSIPGPQTPVYTPQGRPLTWPPSTPEQFGAWCASVVASEPAQTIPQDK